MARLSLGSRGRMILLALSLFIVISLARVSSASAQQVSVPGFAFSSVLRNITKPSVMCMEHANLTDNDTPGAMCLTPPDPSVEAISGRCYFNGFVQFISSPSSPSNSSFSTMFSFNTFIHPSSNKGEGFVFFISPDLNWAGGTGESLGWVNASTNSSGRNFAVEFDILKNADLSDLDDNHVGINLNSAKSLLAMSTSTVNIDLATYSTEDLIYAWVDYDGAAVEVSVSQERRKPCKPLLSLNLDLHDVLWGDMYVGFASSTGEVSSSQTTIFDWSFNSTGKAVNIYDVHADCKRHIAWGLILGSTCGGVGVITLMLLLSALIWYQRTRAAELHEALKELENLDSDPKKFLLPQLSKATNQFSEKIGGGGCGTVYKGTVTNSKGQTKDIAVKKIKFSRTPDIEGFIAEVKVVGVLKHKNLVRVLGWCYDQKGEMYLVYEYMPNKNLRELLIAKGFTWEKRIQSLREVAAALVYLHDECTPPVIHQDVKPSNVMFDINNNAHLGDFGTSLWYHPDHHNSVLGYTEAYVAPECLKTGTGSPKADVHSFGILLLEVVTGLNPERLSNELNKWVWKLYHEGRLREAIDPRLLKNAESVLQEMEKVLKLGLSCSMHNTPDPRPTMAQVYFALQNESALLPPSTKVPPLPDNSESKKYRDFLSLAIENEPTVYVSSRNEFLPRNRQER